MCGFISILIFPEQVGIWVFISSDKEYYEKSAVFWGGRGGDALGEGRAGTGGLMPESAIPMECPPSPCETVGPMSRL